MRNRQEIIELIPPERLATFHSLSREDQEDQLVIIREIVERAELSSGGSPAGDFYTRRVLPLIKAGSKPREALQAARKSYPKEFAQEQQARYGRPGSGTTPASRNNLGAAAPGKADGFYTRRVLPLIKGGAKAAVALSAARKQYPEEFRKEQAQKLGRAH